MAVMSANGGLIPWHSGIGTAIGRFQFILGREIGVYLYGRTKERDAIFYLGSDGLASIISFRSTQVEFPILEFRPSRSFATDQSSALLFQFYGGLDIPHHIEVIEPIGVSKPDLENVWFWGIRLIFDWRHYF